MKKPKGFDNVKKHYAVYYIGTGHGVYARDHTRIYLGDTWAVSPEKACSNVRYRQRDSKNPHGGYACDIMGDYMEEGTVDFYYKAEEIN